MHPRTPRSFRLVGAHASLLAEVAENRQRAFTLLVRTYDEVRRAVSYLRWREGDADAIAPSLWAGRGGRRKGNALRPKSPRATPPGNAAPHAEAAPAAPPVVPPVETTSANTPTTAAATVRIGDPFLSRP